VARVALAALYLGAWEFFAGKPGEPHVLIDTFYVSQPSDIFHALQQWWDQGVLMSNIWITLQETLIGFMIGAALGLIFGVILGASRTLGDICFPFITALNSTPKLALVPLFIIWFGVEMRSKVALVVTVTFFLVFYSTFAGVRDVDEQLINTLRVMGARRYQIHRKVTLQSAVSWIISGLRVSVPYALVAAVTGEMLASNKGMGYLLVDSANQFDTAGVFAGIFVLIAMGLALNYAVTLLESWLLRWKPKR
jgi:NitT/TauT family transport system permease protein